MKNAPFSQRIGDRARRMHAARSRKKKIWLGLGLVGALGWMIVIPLMAGLWTGRWLDRLLQTHPTFTLSLMLIGLFIGGYSVWRFFLREVT